MDDAARSHVELAGDWPMVEARRRALEALIDAATDRQGRDGDFVFSLGSNVGVGTLAPWARDRTDERWCA